MKLTGLEIKEFYDAWPVSDEYYLDDFELDVYDEVGNFVLEPAEKYELSLFGHLFKNGGLHHQDEGMSLYSVFKKWRKTQESTTFCAVVPKNVVDDFKEFCSQRKIKIT